MAAEEHKTTDETAAPPATHTGVEAASPLDVGPSISLGAVPLLVGIALAAGAAGLVGWLVTMSIKPAAAGAVWQAPLAVFGSFLVGMALLRPWRKRPVGRWPFAWLAHSGLCFLLTIIAAALLLYSAPPDDRVALGLTIAVAHFAALLAEAALIGRRLRGRSG